MRKNISIGLLCLFLTVCSQQNLFAQKQVVDPNLEGIKDQQWPSADAAQLSPDGKYVCYTLNNVNRKGSELVVQSLDGSWKKTFEQLSGEVFTSDSKYLIFKNDRDSLCFQRLGENELKAISGVSFYRLIYSQGIDHLLYKQKDSLNTLVVENLFTGKQFHFNSVNAFYAFSNLYYGFKTTITSNLVLLEKYSFNNKVQLSELNLASGQETIFWDGGNASSFIFNNSEDRVLFFGKGADDSMQDESLWCYDAKNRKAKVLLTSKGLGLGGTLNAVISELKFSNDSKKLFFKIKEKLSKPSVTNDDGVMVDVWNYRDRKLQSEQLQQKGIRPESYLAVVDITSGEVKRLKKLQSAVENIFTASSLFTVVMKEKKGDGSQVNKDDNATYLRSLDDDSEVYLGLGRLGVFCSPDGCFALWFDQWKKSWNCYDWETKKQQVISKGILYPVYNERAYDFARLPPYDVVDPVDFVVWIKNSPNVLIYDDYDIWKVDLTNPAKAINITKGYGRKNHIKLRIAWNQNQNEEVKQVNEGDTLLLGGFNKETKENGFFRFLLGSNKPPQKLGMEPIFMYVDLSQMQYRAHSQTYLQKAEKANVWLVKRQTESQAPNYFATADFKNFTQLTDVQPQKNYNWYTTELIHYPLERKSNQPGVGVLYKPENFDSTKKYPVIFTYYEQYSDHLHFFLRPELPSDQIDIPYFVSRGYIVFVPDIYYEPGNPGFSALNYVESAARYLSKLPFVDAKRMGIQGHSFGGYETNFIVTHSRMFAAACESAGMSDLISEYGGLRLGLNGYGVSEHSFMESGQGRMKYTLWQRMDLYINNSPVLFADRITAPLLILHNLKDGNVPFAQGIEMFTALQRLNKRVWMLQYDDGDHGLNSEESKRDYTKRLLQFFDHYLKGQPAPVWMTKGVPAVNKGVETGYALDQNGNCSRNCKVCNKWNQIYLSDKKTK